MSILQFLFPITYLILLFISVSSDDSASSSNAVPSTLIEIEHSLDGGLNYVKRSSFLVAFNTESTGNANSATTTVNSKQSLVKEVLDKNGLYDEKDISDFKKLLITNVNDSLYRIRTRAVPNDNKSLYVSASIPACELLKAGFKEDIVLHLNDKNHIVSLGYSAPIIAMSRTCDSSYVKSPSPMFTRIRAGEVQQAYSISPNAIGAVPAYFGKINLDTIASSVDGEPIKQPPAQKSFLQRYWYVVIMLIYYLIRPSATAEKPKSSSEQINKEE